MNRKFRNGLAGLLLAGASAGLGGCGSVIEAMGRENAANVEARSRIKAAEIMAEAQRSPEYRNEFFACSYIQDDGDGVINRDEIREIKDNFVPGDSTTFCARIYGAHGRTLSKKLIIRSGPKAMARNEGYAQVIPSNSAFMTTTYDFPRDTPKSSLTMQWFIDGVHAGETTVYVGCTAEDLTSR